MVCRVVMPSRAEKYAQVDFWVTRREMWDSGRKEGEDRRQEGERKERGLEEREAGDAAAIDQQPRGDEGVFPRVRGKSFAAVCPQEGKKRERGEWNGRGEAI